MQNPNVLRRIIDTTKDEEIKSIAESKLKFDPLSSEDEKAYKSINAMLDASKAFDLDVPDEILENAKHANNMLRVGGKYSVHDPEFLTGANISVTISQDLMDAVENDDYFELKFPDVENYSESEMDYYNENWHEVGDVRKWEERGMAVKSYRKIKARELWNLINVCATYSAEPGIFFIDNANDMTNAKAYGQQVVATNPCGEQPLAPYSVCNLSAINLSKFADEETKSVDFETLKRTVRRGVRMQDNVIDKTPYFLEANKKQALGERRVGLGVMGLHDLLIKCEKRYGSEEGNILVDKVFEVIATTAYRTSIELAKEKGSFPFLVGKNKKETRNLREAFINTGYMKTLPVDIREDILEHGIRNSHLLTVAPTGSTGTMIGVSTGLEPYFSFTYYRSGRLGKFIEVNAEILEEYLEKNPEVSKDDLPEWFCSTMDLDPEEHVNVQCIIQRWVDSSISKTVNAPRGYQVDDVAKVYESLYKKGAKGGTVYVDGSRDSQVLSLTNEENEMSDITEEDSNKEKKDNVIEFHSKKKEVKEDNIGVEVGNTCPTCRIGTIERIAGCNTCDSCGQAQTCGL